MRKNQLGLVWLLLSLWLAGCGTMVVDHGFEFDANAESPEIRVLAYQYGNSKNPGANDQEDEQGRIGQQSGIHGEFLRGDFLYVKWKIRETGEILEDRVDLKSRLPRDIAKHTIHFVVDGRQLYVYLINWEDTKLESCRVWKGKKLERRQDRIFRMYCANEITQVYPDQPQR